MIRFVAAGLLALSSTAALSDCRFDTLDQGRVLKLDATRFPSLQGKSLPSLSLMRYQQGRYVPVPYQFDELDEHGQVWFASTGFALDGAPGRLDGHDQLLAMLTDAGRSAPAGSQPESGQVLADIAVAHGCHFYLVQDNSERSGRYYVSHDPETGVTNTALYRLDVEPDNELNWRYLGYLGYQGDGSIIDTLKMRMSAGVLSRFTRMSLDNHNLRPQAIGHRLGPIRSVMHLKTRVVFAGIPVMTLQVQAMRYAAHYEAHTYARIPDLYRATLKDPQVSVTIDGNAQYGARVYTARHSDDPVVVDGEPDARDQAFADQAVTTEDNWILFDSQRDFVLLTELSVPEALKNMPLGLVYQDDRTLDLDPEQFPGQLPNLGYRVEGWPDPQELQFSVSLYFDNGLHDMAAGRFARLRAEPVQATVTRPAASTVTP
ncbi:hypothetical protein A11A3_12700 [Alcanivorax hongdengensis A-11-3]|uniref:Lipoprotein n=1 Tax=Alcanivorax hongdengensis A-11-3 TaxID=1177179 RepID=L0W9F4_9GAMM|nr:hypothetical protein [Alcanivorax hongdengensis]EKF73586.1 hypothetical protein A11A3_12700 [Alcanivorax hongdengensis A-11-3]